MVRPNYLSLEEANRRVITVDGESSRNASRGDHESSTDSSFWGDQTFQTFLGVPFYPDDVKGVVDRVQNGMIKASWCVGPVVKLSLCMPVVYAILAFVVASMAAYFCECLDGKQLVWPWWLWLIWLPTGTTLLFVECHIVRHMCVPYHMKVGSWKGLPTFVSETASILFDFCCPDLCRHIREEHSFSLWMVVWLFCSVIRLSSFFTANMFFGMVVSDLRLDRCGGHKVEQIWHLSLQQAKLWPGLASEATLSSIFVVMFVAQIAHLLLGVLHAWPRWKQWSTGGLKPPEKQILGRTTYEQDFEQEIIEYINFRDEDSRRPEGTRFSYVTLAGVEVTSSSAVEIVGEACGMSGIEKIEEAILDDYHKAIEAIETAEISNDHEQIKQAVVEARSLMQDARQIFRSVLSHIFLYGILFSGINLQLQVTYVNARCFEVLPDGTILGMAEQCPNSSNLWLGVLSGFLSVILTMSKAWKTLSYAMHVRRSLDKYARWHASVESYILNDTSDLRQKHDQVESIQSVVSCYVWPVLPAAAVLLLTFLWATTKWVMTTFVCEDHIWDVDVNLVEGCVHITGK